MVRLINTCGHRISCNLLEGIEKEFALKVINEQAVNRVLIPEECYQPNNPPVALMAADKIDHLECTLSRAGTSHRVNLILFLKQEPQEGSEENLGDSDQVPDHHSAKRKCKRSLAADVIKKEIAEYYRVGVSIIESFRTCSISRTGNDIEASVHYRVLVQLRKLRIHPLLLVPSWKGFFIQIRDNIVIQSPNRYLDTPDSPSTTSRRLTRYVTWRLFCEVGGCLLGGFSGGIIFYLAAKV